MVQLPPELLAFLDPSMGAGGPGISPPLPGEPGAQFPNTPLPGEQPPMGEYPAPQPQPIKIDRDPAQPTKKEQGFAREYVTDCIKRSVEFMEQKIPDFELFEDLYWNKRLLNQWRLSQGEALSYNRTARNRHPDPTEWQANNTIAVQPVVDSIAQAIFRVIFRTGDYLQVKASPRNQTGSIEDLQFPTAKKLQQVLLNQCADMRFASRLYEYLQDWLIFGTGVAKTPWYRRVETETFMDAMTGAVQKLPTTIYRQGTALDLVNPAQFLPDPDALSSDIDKWSFIGDWSEVPYYRVRGLLQGPFNLGHKEFMARWPERGDDRGQAPAITIKQDEDARSGLTSGGGTALKVWDWHGVIPFDSGARECVCAFVSGLGEQDCSDAVMVRLQTRAALPTGGRPYVLSHFVPRSGPLGKGIIEANLDIIWQLSRLINMFMDTVALISCPTPLVKANSPLHIEIQQAGGGNVWYPGKPLIYNNAPDEVLNFNLTVSDLSAILTGIQHLERQWEQRTTVSDSTRAISETKKTATETAALQEQAAQPIEVLLKLLDEGVLIPFGKIALAHIKTHLYEDQPIWIKGPNGIPQAATLTVEELQTGEYEVRSAISAQDPAKISRAQVMAQLAPALEQAAMPMLLLENKLYSRAGLFDQVLENLGATEGATVLNDVDDATKQQILKMMGMSAGGPAVEGEGPSPGGENPPPGTPPGSLQPGTEGGPAGPEPSNLNEILQQQQYQGAGVSPVPPGQQTPAG